MKRKATAGLALIGVSLAVALTGCDNGYVTYEEIQVIEQKRYEACLEAGGSYWADTDNNDFSCTLPGGKVTTNHD